MKMNNSTLKGGDAPRKPSRRSLMHTILTPAQRKGVQRIMDIAQDNTDMVRASVSERAPSTVDVGAGNSVSFPAYVMDDLFLTNTPSMADESAGVPKHVTVDVLATMGVIAIVDAEPHILMQPLPGSDGSGYMVAVVQLSGRKFVSPYPDGAHVTAFVGGVALCRSLRAWRAKGVLPVRVVLGHPASDPRVWIFRDPTTADMP